MAKRIEYDDFAKDAASNSYVTPSSIMSVANANSILHKTAPINYITFEDAGIDLNDAATRFYSSGDSVGYVSAATSGADCHFSTPITLTLTFYQLYRSSGITLYFWQNFCSRVNVSYYNDSTQIYACDYVCNELTHFFALPTSLTTVYWNKIILSFSETEQSYQFVKLYGVDFGHKVIFDKFFSFSALEEVNLISDDLPINKLEFSASSTDTLSLQDGQKVSLYSNDTLIGEYNLSDYNRDTYDKVSLTGLDNVNLLDTIYFDGGLYTAADGYTVSMIISDIISLTGVQIDIDAAYTNVAVLGWLPHKTCRYTLMQIAFAAGCIVNTSRDNNIRLKAPQTAISSTIDGSRILGIAKYTQSKPVTKASLVSYTYTPQTTETKKIFDGTVTAHGVSVYFDAPYVSISSTSGYDKDCLDVEFTPGYLFMRVTSGSDVTITMNAYPYTVTETTYSQTVNTYPNLTENLKEYKDYTLINSSNVSTKLAQITDYLTYSGTVDAKIILDGEQVGDIVSIETKYNGIKTGKIKSLDLTIGSNMIAQAVIDECLADE